MRKLLAVAPLWLIAGVIACNAQSGATPSPSDPPTGSPVPTSAPTSTPAPSLSPTTAPSPSPTGAPDANVAVVRIEQTGGMLPPWITSQNYPTVVLYADGRLIMQGPQIELYPGPALPNLQVTHLSQHGVEQVLAWAAEAGLAGPDRQLGQPLPDAGVFLFTVVSAQGTHHTSVSNMGESNPEIAAVAKFQDLMLNLRQWLPDDIASDDTPYEWDRLQVVSVVADPANIPDPNLVTRFDWPLEPLATLGKSLSEPADYRCFVVEGDDAASLKPLLERANELSLWTSDGADYQLSLHPLLPDDEGCVAF